MSDSPKSRNLKKYRPKGSNPQDYNSVDLGCADSKVWSSLGALVLITSLFSFTYFLAPRTAPVTWKSWAGISKFSSFWVKGNLGIKKMRNFSCFPNEKRKSSKTLKVFYKAHTSRVNSADNLTAYHFSQFFIYPGFLHFMEHTVSIA